MDNPTHGQQLSAIHASLAAGNIAAATEALGAVAKQVNDAEIASGAQAAAPPPPRTPDEVIVDLFHRFNALLGNHPAIHKTIVELEGVLKTAAGAAVEAATVATAL